MAAWAKHTSGNTGQRDLAWVFCWLLRDIYPQRGFHGGNKVEEDKEYFLYQEQEIVYINLRVHVMCRQGS